MPSNDFLVELEGLEVFDSEDRESLPPVSSKTEDVLASGQGIFKALVTRFNYPSKNGWMFAPGSIKSEVIVPFMRDHAKFGSASIGLGVLEAQDSDVYMIGSFHESDIGQGARQEIARLTRFGQSVPVSLSGYSTKFRGRDKFTAEEKAIKNKSGNEAVVIFDDYTPKEVSHVTKPGMDFAKITSADEFTEEYTERLRKFKRRVLSDVTRLRLDTEESNV